MILTGSHDRNAIVWKFNEEKKNWHPDLVILQKNKRAFLDGSWSDQGNKFCLGSGTHRLYIGFYENENNWWNTKKISGLKIYLLL